MMFDLAGRTALVTGAGQNVGAGIARALADHGATLVVNDIDADRARAVADEVGGTAAVFDVTDLAAVTDAIEAIGDVDILVNNAGNAGATTMALAPFLTTDPASWDGPIGVNLFGVLHCARAAVGGMCERGWGRVITISSAAGTAGGAIGVAAYSAGKGAGLSFTRTLALEVAGTGVTANNLALGLIGMPELAAMVPVGRTGTPEDVGAACVWMASDEAAWLTGQTIQLNGGMVTT